MSMETAGFLLAVAGSFFYGLYMIPRKASAVDTDAFVWVMGLSVAVVCFLAMLVSGQRSLIHPYDIMLTAACGVLWTVGTVGYAEGIRLIGLTRSTPIKNLNPALAAVYGVVIFGEYGLDDPAALALALVGAALMTVSAVLFGRTTSERADDSPAFDSRLSESERERHFRAGVVWSMISALGFSGYAVPMKLVYRHMEGQAYFGSHVAVFSWLSAMGLAVGLSTVIYYAARNPSRLMPRMPLGKEWAYPAAAGLMWSLATGSASTAMVYIPVAVAWPISNLSTLVAVGLGIWVYKEIQPEQHRAEIVWGMTTSVVGIALLGLATSRGTV